MTYDTLLTYSENTFRGRSHHAAKSAYKNIKYENGSGHALVLRTRLMIYREMISIFYFFRVDYY